MMEAQKYVAVPAAADPLMELLTSFTGKPEITSDSLAALYSVTLCFTLEGRILFGWLNEEADENAPVRMTPIPLDDGEKLRDNCIRIISASKSVVDSASRLVENERPHPEEEMDAVQMKINGKEVSLFFGEKYAVCFVLR
ncbi:unnamed protein product [Kuraishia capsulata CBS 1993]|uniref:Uncharacterized protein n=1 Tax=Kuraishia capsulata CBS 1993 TaxID=1382522 RepID=W6MSJ0_9ASCO|nr:uncharacterized protein KUCA_T00005764001 [Kuraishia capsulata CBS 1993]CDK29771.1 unnamed protein product [Kuraishia capsulata CBS 1993]